MNKNLSTETSPQASVTTMDFIDILWINALSQMLFLGQARLGKPCRYSNENLVQQNHNIIGMQMQKSSMLFHFLAAHHGSLKMNPIISQEVFGGFL